ncbi:YheT family hydrolase [Leptolyngbya sp. FACHB-261]|uniref:YheT family hydrolase n=1 Tax=Leptolyngbya sp. FACHB-261 TaxID=2692806 RepID=UPI00168778F4|nr:alpha/beta fold hydrolase [Leptolyngbya sp. FACHB-261]MBD2103512.1 alpha/beta fold hydrolase [Leptolyngbya sp. FACHB-261]
MLREGLAMTVYTATWGPKHWQQTVSLPEPDFRPLVVEGAGGVPLAAQLATPATSKGTKGIKGTIIATYGITGSLEDAWLLQVLRRKAIAQGYAVVLFDWRAHGKTAELSATLTSDGLNEGEDFVCLARRAKQLGCPAPFFLAGFSLGGQLALWGLKAAQASGNAEIAGAVVICPSLESNRSLVYLERSPLGRYLEQAIAAELKRLAWHLHALHPGKFDARAIERANTIRGFDRELVISRLGFSTVEDYYKATSPLYLLPSLDLPALILYASDDPMFDPTLVPELKAASAQNPALDLVLTPYGGHVGYLSSRRGMTACGDPDPWWAWNRALEWLDRF